MASESVTMRVNRRTYTEVKAQPMTVADVLDFADVLRAHHVPLDTIVDAMPGVGNFRLGQLYVCVEEDE